MKLFKIELGLVVAMAAAACLAAGETTSSIALSNDVLRVSADRESAALDVVDMRCGRVWRQMAGEGAKVEVLSSAADSDGKGAALSLRIDGVGGG